MEYEIRQLKLVNGDEVICQVVEWPDEEVANMIVTKVYEIVGYQSSIEPNTRYYSLKPWMVYQEETETQSVISINADHILGEMAPSEKLLGYYFANLDGAEETEEDFNSKVDDYVSRLKKIFEDAGDLDLDEEGVKKVIKFPGKDKLH